MKLGIDLKELQNGNSVRGIGEVTKQVTSRLIPLLLANKFVEEISLYIYPNEATDVIALLNVSSDPRIAVKYFDPELNNKSLHAKLKSALHLINEKEIDALDVYLAYSYVGYLPKSANTYLVWYDAITYKLYELDKKYTTRFPFNQLKKYRLLMKLGKAQKKWKMTSQLSKANHLISISEFSKKDLQNTFQKINAPIDVAFLGVSENPAKTSGTKEYKVEVPKKKYLLFLGGTDGRRDVTTLIEQFNKVKQTHVDMQLVLAGKSFENVDAIERQDIKTAILNSPFKDDIITYGYITDEFKQELYQNAFAVVYPTLYEGFGLPVLEAMLAKTLILTYNNSSLPEVGGEHAFYVDNGKQIATKIEEMLQMTPDERQQHIDAAYEYAKQFTWDKTAQRYYDIIMSNKA
ncbi:MAG: glycosyltransferase family 4 protein [Mycoplasmataceae bacterium]|jgi:glycosyltransferase involved in cell wall biosynthesis|nr:glycosyltransferase family 4 protein [Mycoplasmataceae bacterium]